MPITDVFASNVFDEAKMKEYLAKDTFQEMEKTIREGKPLNPKIAEAVAHGMKEWALSKGATHFTHWFQPLTGVTAEKHDSFLNPSKDHSISLEFSGKELVKGEPDASSFPSGGLRATFEARGYTAWDPTSYAFIKEDTLCIPTAFCSYSGEVLDKKTPLLRSMEAISEEAVKILSLFGKTDVKRVITTVGAEQEYFLIDVEDYKKRKDLRLTGRTLFGARSPKGQEKDDHYFGALRTRVAEFMADLDKELWKLGIPAKTRHNEVAPCQHELAPVFSVSNVAVDHNQIMMELMKKIAPRHGLSCILHEKPFEGVNGSGKHNNWSISTDTGVNLLEPGDNPKDNAQFLLFLSAVIKAVDEYQDLLRISVASAGNDHRLGANEAPPAIVSMFLGDELTDILESVASGKSLSGRKKAKMALGVHVLPDIPKDTTDRNRTSPMAFTGNKFEFRMPGSSFSMAGPNVALNTIVAKALREFYEVLKDAPDFGKAVTELVGSNYRDHKRIVFNGNAYSEEWVEEAEDRGLLNLQSAPEAFDQFTAPKNIALFKEFGIYSEKEIVSRYEIHHEEYSKTIHIEALTMLDIAIKRIIPASSRYASDLASGINQMRSAINMISPIAEEDILRKVISLTNELYGATNVLGEMINEAEKLTGSLQSHYYREEVLPRMEDVRRFADNLELIVAKDYWPLPTYSDMLFYV